LPPSKAFIPALPSAFPGSKSHTTFRAWAAVIAVWLGARAAPARSDRERTRPPEGSAFRPAGLFGAFDVVRAIG
jgi:hypothetical protein